MAHRDPQLTLRDIAYVVAAAFVIIVGSWFAVTAIFAIAGQPL